MALNAKFVHTNIVTENWQRPAAFYEDAIGLCSNYP